ncbi:MAG: aminotransferase class I/II-fold pyridoxal phosphate-dependent enzyme [Gemmatimonadota bacterium]|nr:aminotransferase class I/II-fold pyridoxal phosphate-dependent enzyme [Gemmatimonadota bacterium]MDH3421965.1 aminotransferase class I/II-fold pyridoxal phosphate-dependent enzyme [Gemmatimonadota bacterium]
MARSKPPERKRGQGTLGIHSDAAERTAGSPVVPPIVQSATFHWADPSDGDLLYTRWTNNPNQELVADKVAALEGMEAGIALGSGMGAIACTLLALTEAGDHIAASSLLYGGTNTLLASELPRRGVETSFVDPRDGDWEAALRPETRVIYLELPTNPTMRVPDPRPVVALARRKGIVVVADVTFASPVNLRAGSLGVDVVVHSATKYLGGHADIIAGVAAGPRNIIDQVNHVSRFFGPVLDPHAAWLLDRGLRTLEVRVRRHNENAQHVAEWLARQPGVTRVDYPGLASHPDHAVAKELLDGFGGMVGFVLEGGAPAADRFVSALEVAIAAPSLGGVETLVSQPRYTSHVGLSAEEREARGVPDGFVRISVGIEDRDDLTADFQQALAAAG